jgi:hypothetical protein
MIEYRDITERFPHLGGGYRSGVKKIHFFHNKEPMFK